MIKYEVMVLEICIPALSLFCEEGQPENSEFQTF